LGTEDDFNVFNLTKAINGITYKFEESTYHSEALHYSKIRLYMLRQGKDVTNVKFLELFHVHVSIVEQFGGEISRDPIILREDLELMGVDASTATDKELLDASRVRKENYLAMALIRASD
jgi:hypothetical protein